MMTKKRIWVLLAALVLCATLPLCAEGGKEAQAKGVKLTFWIQPNADMLVTAKTLNDTPFGKELLKRTGVDVEFQHPPAVAASALEAFNLLIASGSNFPDILCWDWTTYPGGARKAIDDKIIIKLNPYIEGGKAPNIAKIFKDKPEFNKLSKLDDGTYYIFPFMRFDDVLNTYFGPVLRKDWLEELNLTPPRTIDEWYVVLKAFKEKKNAMYPLTFQDPNAVAGNSFVGAYGAGRYMMLVNGKVAYGPMQPGYKQFLTTFAKWYAEGLLDPEWLLQDRKTIDAKITGDQSGAYIGTPDSWIGTFIRLMREKNPKVDMVGVPNPRLKATDKPAFVQKDWAVVVNNNNSAAITTSCKNPEVAVRFLDYTYGTEGMRLSNFGIEGESYNLKDGKPIFTDYILKNPQGLTMKQAMARYLTDGLGYYPGVQLKDPVQQQRFFPAQNLAIEAWMDGDVNWRVPPVSPSAAESAAYAKIMTDVKTYVDESYAKFVMGTMPISEYDTFVANLKKMGIEDAIKILQNSVDRFNKR